MYSINLVLNSVRVVAQVVTNLAISLIRLTEAERIGFEFRPVTGPDTTFVDPVTARVFHILWETNGVNLQENQSTKATFYVVADDEIGQSIILGMDTLLALGMSIKWDGDEVINPLFPIPGQENIHRPDPVIATGLPVSFMSREYAGNGFTVVPHLKSEHYDLLTNTTFPIFGKVAVPLPTNQDFFMTVTSINTPLILGLDALTACGYSLEFPDIVTWPQIGVVRPYRQPELRVRGPTCPSCGRIGHVRSRCTEQSE